MLETTYLMHFRFRSVMDNSQFSHTTLVQLQSYDSQYLEG